MPDHIDYHNSKPKHNPWLVALTVTLATFMEVLDTSIANVALPHMAGSLGASQEEATWVLTSYLVSSAVVLPISGWLATRYGRKRFYMTCVVVFTVCSFLCGIAQSLPMLILARVLQGAGGGGLAPSEQAILADTFPVSKRGQAFAVYGMAVVVAPAIGPTLGGWITDNFTWHWIFFINIPIGILSIFLSQRMVEDPPYLNEQRKKAGPVDTMGLGLIAIGVGCLEFVLDKGQEKDWFGDGKITTFFILAMCALVAFAIWEWRHEDPIVDLKLLKNRNFGTAIFLQFILGMVLFGSTVLIPQFLQVLMGYTAEQAGMALSPGGFILMLMMPLAGRLIGKMDARLLVAIGYAITALGLYNLTRLDLETSFGTIVLWRMFQVCGLAFVFIPISTLNYVGVPYNKNNQISSFSNFARNLGGSVGTALLTTFLQRTQQTHQSVLGANVVAGSARYSQFIDATKHSLMQLGQSSDQAAQIAVGHAYQVLVQQSSMLSYMNAFWWLSVIIACLIPLPFVMRKPPAMRKPPEEAMGH
ncbi:DHA2 family efflux MFS transporter permease subunit [Alloacidobacterium sp.]|uniref:DHA2 family efflux MFS transporter permease subunit n=1 Tax=Alloacidobacterium sp. TaxID=2951999 RepID=UPI002D6E555C|nr:DHA2 family efflux MFS transporter permease subunit [Alloacidobacterium sp.]HYK35123.1 DHA2 family efflux MFS transporter permease subunit [Alloacidobacterium sp.]